MLVTLVPLLSDLFSSHSEINKIAETACPAPVFADSIKHWRTLTQANPDTYRPHVLTTSPMNFWYLGTVTSSRYIQREDNRLVPQIL